MKNQLLKVILFCTALIGIVSCDIEPLDSGLEDPTNPELNTNFSVYFGSTHYSTNDALATIEEGSLTIEAEDDLGVFELYSSGATIGTYTNSQVMFTYTETETSDVYASLNPLTGTSNSELKVTSINFSDQTISGTFFFTGYKVVISGESITVQEKVFSQGVFINIPYGGGVVNPVDPEPSNGDYFPMAIGNIWNYTSDATLELGSSQVISGRTYYKEANSFFMGVSEWPNVEEFVSKSNGDYYVRVNSVSGAPNPIEPQEAIILKDYLNQGGTWSDTITLSFVDEDGGVVVTTIVFNNVIEQKNITMTVNGVTYQNVIKVKTTDETTLTYNGVPFGEPSPSLNETWFAKDVGIIKIRSVSEDEPAEVYDLIDYDLN